MSKGGSNRRESCRSDGGSLDTSFSADGRGRTNFGNADGATGVALQADGKIVAVGVAGGSPTGYDFALARYAGG
jgi:hypothetical protein